MDIRRLIVHQIQMNLLVRHLNIGRTTQRREEMLFGKRIVNGPPGLEISVRASTAERPVIARDIWNSASGPSFGLSREGSSVTLAIPNTQASTNAAAIFRCLHSLVRSLNATSSAGYLPADRPTVLLATQQLASSACLSGRQACKPRRLPCRDPIVCARISLPSATANVNVPGRRR
jgi:hypothetical protein